MQTRVRKCLLVSRQVQQPDRSQHPTEHSPDVSMDGSADVPDESPAVSETPAAMDTSKTTDAPEYSPNVSMDESADVLDETPADSGNEIPGDTAEAQVDVDDSPGATDAPTIAEAEGEDEDVPKDADRGQATEDGNDEGYIHSLAGFVQPDDSLSSHRTENVRQCSTTVSASQKRDASTTPIS